MPITRNKSLTVLHIAYWYQSHQGKQYNQALARIMLYLYREEAEQDQIQ